jgi:hypothetical protein
MNNFGEKIFLRRKVRKTIYMNVVMLMVLQQKTCHVEKSHCKWQKIATPKHSKINFVLSWWEDSQPDWSHLHRKSEVGFFKIKWLWHRSQSGACNSWDRLSVNKWYEHSLIIVQTVHHVLHYPFIYQLSCNTLCFFTHKLVVAPLHSGVC